MIIVLSNTADATADFACARLRDEGRPFVRLDTDKLTDAVKFTFAAGRVLMFHRGKALGPESVSCVWFRRPRPIQIEASDPAEAVHAAAEWAEALEGFLACVPHHLWINHPARAGSASHKIEQIYRALRLGFTVPETLVTQDETEARQFLEKHGEVIVKPLSGGYIERPSGEHALIYTTRVSPKHAEQLSLVARCPSLFQAEIKKAYDVRVTAVDSRFSTVALRKAATGGRQVTDIRRDNWEGVEYERIDLPEQVQSRLSMMLAEYGIRFAAVDFAVDVNGEWVFFEVNTGGQWAWLDMQAGTDIAGDLVWAMS